MLVLHVELTFTLSETNLETQGNEKNNITWKIQKQKNLRKNLTENTENRTYKEMRKIT